MTTSVINSDNGLVSGTSGLKTTGGDDGNLNIQSNGTTVAAVSSTGVAVTGNVSTTGAFATSNWTITESGGVLYFKYGGTNKGKLDSSGNFTVTGNVIAYGTV
jgi:hypothetical protein